MTLTLEVPHADEAERSVLGAVLIDPRYLDEVGDLLLPADFYRPAHQRIFRAMAEMAEDHEPIDPVTLSMRLGGDGVVEAIGGAAYISRLLDGIPRLVNAKHYAAIVRERSKRRAVLRLANELAVEASEAPDIDTAIHQAEQRLLELHASGQGSSIRPLFEALADALDELERRSAAGPGVTGVPTGFPDFDVLVDGLQKTDLIVIAASTSVGKTAFAMQVASHAALRAQKSTLVFSLEMSDTQLAKRVAFADAPIDSKIVRLRQLTDRDWAGLDGSARRIRAAPIYVDRSCEASVAQMVARCRAHKQAHGLDLVVIDYLQLVRPPPQCRSREEEVAAIARGLKSLAREFSVPVLTLSQLTKDADKREGPPQIADVRESGAIYHAADVFAFLWREGLQLERLGKRVPEEKRNTAELLVRKHRNGPLGTIRLRWEGKFARYQSVSDRGATDASVRDGRAAAAGDDTPDPPAPF